MADFASRSFGQPSNWHCPNDSSFGLAFNTLFPLPKQNTWTVFCPSNAICMRVISLLRMRHSTLDEWRRIPLIGQTNGKIGAPMSTLWEWTQVCNSRGLQNGSGSSQDTPPAQEHVSTAGKRSQSSNGIFGSHGCWADDHVGAREKPHQSKWLVQPLTTSATDA